jgi:tetratricopeptide (TPR) repeat protein
MIDSDATAELAYRAAVAANPSHLPALEALVRLSLARGEITHAINALKNMLDLIPLDHVDRISDIRQQLGELCQEAGDLNAARSYFELVVSEFPKRMGALSALADLYGAGGQWQRAVDTLEKMVRLDDVPARRAEILYRQGEILRVHLGDEDRAASAYLKASDLDPDNVATLRRLVDHYWQVDEPAQVVEIAGELDQRGALFHDATGPDTLARIGVAAALVGDVSRASKLAAALGASGAGALAATLAEAVSRKPDALDLLVGVARALCQPPGPPIDAVRAVLVMRGLNDPKAETLSRRL